MLYCKYLPNGKFSLIIVLLNRQWQSFYVGYSISKINIINSKNQNKNVS